MPVRRNRKRWLPLRPELLLLCCVTAAGLFAEALAKADAAELSSQMSLALDRSRGELQFQFKSRPLLVYAFATNQFKPYVRELYAPNGVNVLRDAPADHLHHHGLMYAIRINGVNFWEERDEPGVEKSVGLLNQRTGHDAQGRPQASFTHLIHWVTSSNRWVADSEPVALLVERRTITLTVDETVGEVALRWQAAFEVGRAAGKVKLHGSGYNGFGLRLPEPFDHVARHINSASLPYTPEQKWDVTAARWSAVSHTVGGRDVMVALFSRPQNKGEARFFTMLNPFAYLSVTQDLEKRPLEYMAGDTFALDYLLTVYSEKKSTEFLNQRLQQWEKE